MPSLGRRVRRGGKLHGLERSLPSGSPRAKHHGVPSIRGRVRRVGKLHGQQRRMPGGRVPAEHAGVPCIDRALRSGRGVHRLRGACPPDAVNQSAPVGPTITASHDKQTNTTTIAWPTEVVARSVQRLPWHDDDRLGLRVQPDLLRQPGFGNEHDRHGVSEPGADVLLPGLAQEATCNESNLGQNSDPTDRPNTLYCPLAAPDTDADGTQDNLDNCP